MTLEEKGVVIMWCAAQILFFLYVLCVFRSWEVNYKVINGFGFGTG
jgi:hypothetical protein